MPLLYITGPLSFSLQIAYQTGKRHVIRAVLFPLTEVANMSGAAYICRSCLMGLHHHVIQPYRKEV